MKIGVLFFVWSVAFAVGAKRILLFSQQEGPFGKCIGCIEMENWVKRLGSSLVSHIALSGERREEYLKFGVTSIPCVVILGGSYGKVIKIEEMNMEAVKHLIRRELKRDKMLICLVIVGVISLKLIGILMSVLILMISGGLELIKVRDYDSQFLLALSFNVAVAFLCSSKFSHFEMGLFLLFLFTLPQLFHLKGQ